MAKQRLVNCDFINDSAFKVDTSNKAKLLYLMLIVNADDKGFVGNTKEIVESLQKNDNDFRNEVNLELLENDYNSALNELLDKGFLYVFKNNHGSKVYLIRHWWYHNKLKQGLWTNYYKYSLMVDIVDNEYVLKKSDTKENNKINQDKINQIKVSYDNNLTNEDELSEEDLELLEKFKDR